MNTSKLSSNSFGADSFTIDFWYTPTKPLTVITVPITIGYSTWRENLNWWTTLNIEAVTKGDNRAVTRLMQDKYPGDYELRWDPSMTELVPVFKNKNKELLWKMKFR